MRILVLAPHTDDAEISCGGTISRFMRENNEVRVVSFSPATKSIPNDFNKNATETEFSNSMRYIGIKDYMLFRYPTRHFPEYRQEILDNLITYKENFYPDVVLLPNSFDVHQDHQVIHQEGIRAFRKSSTIFGYENIWNSMGKSNFSTYIKLTHGDMRSKMIMVNCYKSQIYKNPLLENTVLNLMELRGREIGTLYAETFETIRSII